MSKIIHLNDITAGISVSLVAIPLCLGIAIASGLSPLSGIISGIVGGIVVGALSQSSLSVSGPAAGLIAIISSALPILGLEQFFVAVVLSGLLQIIFGISKVAKISQYVPHSVITGMLSAIGITLIIKQIPNIWGVDFNNPHFNTLIIGIICIIILLLWEKFFSKKIKIIPGSLIVVCLGTIISLMFTYYFPILTLNTQQLISLPIINSISQISNYVHITNLSLGRNNIQVYITAITLAIVASIETILNIHAIDKMDPRKAQTPLNRELVAQGIGNTISGLIGGLPITSVAVRSLVNLHNHAQSKASTIIHGIIILCATLFLTQVINLIPISSLAAILIFTGYKLASPTIIYGEWKKGWLEFVTYFVTIVCIIIEDLLIGVIIGIITYYVLNYIYTTYITTQKS